MLCGNGTLECPSNPIGRKLFLMKSLLLPLAASKEEKEYSGLRQSFWSCGPIPDVKEECHATGASRKGAFQRIRATLTKCVQNMSCSVKLQQSYLVGSESVVDQ